MIMSDIVNNNSCVESTAAPEWLSKLENRREKLARAKLGHESDAGAQCNECGDNCPGLDLHFWRKVCRNCKCRKDQHMCIDHNMSGWAQFEILGQIRSQPAYIKIKAIASQPIQLEWVPPNTSLDVISDYMEKLGTIHIPVAGSNAANKRKQQLEFQVPPHDLDASLCDNLTQIEQQQLQQYVQILREQCVGQGTVVRIGNSDVSYGVADYIPKEITPQNAFVVSPEYEQVMNSLGEAPVNDATLNAMLSANKLSAAIINPKVEPTLPKLFMVFSEPISDSVIEFENTRLSNKTKKKLLGLNKNALKSLVVNGSIYDKILDRLKDKDLNVARDPKLGPITEFREEYTSNLLFKTEIDKLLDRTKCVDNPVIQQKNKHATPFICPLQLKNSAQARFSSQMHQDTPMHKVKFGTFTTILYECGLPLNTDYNKDPVFAEIILAEPLKTALQNARAGEDAQQVIISHTPVNQILNEAKLKSLNPQTKILLQNIGINTKMLRSAVRNFPYYNRLFQLLNDKNINFSECKLLKPLAKVNNWLLNDVQLLKDLDNIFAQVDLGSDVKYAEEPLSENNFTFDKFTGIPEIEDLYINPTCAVNAALTSSISPSFHQLEINNSNNEDKSTAPIASVIKCRDCTQPIKFGEVAVKAERAGKEVTWHPECFKCFTCRELLADLVYFFHHGQVYCGRDLAFKLRIPRCKACDELIFTREYTAAENSTFHVKHFCCYQCDKPLAGQEYIPDEKSNIPLCLRCYEKYFAVPCQYCHQPIGPADQGVAWGEIHWHGKCFVCAGAQCTKSLIGERFCVKRNMPFCSPACVRSIKI